MNFRSYVWNIVELWLLKEKLIMFSFGLSPPNFTIYTPLHPYNYSYIEFIGEDYAILNDLVCYAQGKYKLHKSIEFYSNGTFRLFFIPQII